MKKSLFAMFALPALLLASCSDEEVVNGASGDGYVTFTAQLPGEFSRSYSDGSQATRLSYAVYEGNTLIKSSDDNDADQTVFTDKTATLSLQLVKGKTYDFIFWADNEDAPYTFSAADKTITISYSDIKSNDETRDAFFQVEKALKVEGNLRKTIELRRPFAQINFGTDDMAEAAAAGVTPTTTSLKVNTAYTKLNLLTGIASDPQEGGVTFDYNGLPAREESFPLRENGDRYAYISMNYVLTGSQPEEDVRDARKELIDCDFTIADGGGEINTLTLSNVPVQRNYRTNIFGSLLTSRIDYNIVIEPGYNEPGYDVEIDWTGDVADVPAPDADGVIEISRPNQLAGLAQAVKGGESYLDKTIRLTADINLTNIPWTPIGTAEVQGEGGFRGVFDGQGHTISNLNSKATGSKGAAGLFGNITGCVKNVNIRNVNVESDHYAGAVAAYVYINSYANYPADREFGVKNCTVDGGCVVSHAVNNDDGDKVGGIVGGVWQSNAVISGNTVRNLTVEGYRHVGGIIGWADGSSKQGAQAISITDNKAENVTIVQNFEQNYKSGEIKPGNLIGAIAGATNNVTVNASNTAEGTMVVYKNYTAEEGLTVNSESNHKKPVSYTVEGCKVLSITFNTTNKVIVNNSEITPAETNPGGTSRFGLFYNPSGVYDLTITNTRFNGSWSHGIYVQGNSVSKESGDNMIKISGCTFADWGKKEETQDDITTSAAFKVIRSGQFAVEGACEAFADDFIAGNTFDGATLNTGRIHVALGAGDTDTFRK